MVTLINYLLLYILFIENIFSVLVCHCIQSHNYKDRDRYLLKLFKSHFSDDSILDSLNYACRNNDLKLIKILNNHGFNINNKFFFGKTALILACQYGSLDVVKYLIENGADINTKSNFGSTPLMYACEYNHINIVNYLLSFNNIDLEAKDLLLEETAFIIACRNFNFDILNILILKGCNTNITFKNGKTALMYACYISNYDLFNYLLSKNVDINLKDDKKRDALMFAVIYADLRFVKKLLDNNSKINQRSIDGQTPLMLACQYGKYYIVKYLIKNGASIIDEDFNNKNMLMYAAQSGVFSIFIKILKFYLKYQSLDNKILESIIDICFKNYNFQLLRLIVFLKIEDILSLSNILDFQFIKLININLILEIKNNIRFKKKLYNTIDLILRFQYELIIFYSLYLDDFFNNIVNKENYYYIYNMVDLIFSNRRIISSNKLFKLKRKLSQINFVYNIFDNMTKSNKFLNSISFKFD